MTRLAALVILVLAIAAPALALAHHAFQAEADGEAPIILTGTVRQVQWVNPHSQIILTVADAGKPPQDWMVSAGTPNALLRAGVCRQTLKPGDEVTIRGWRAREKRCLDNAATHANTCQAASGTVTLASGRTALIGYGFAAPEASAPDPEHCSPG